MPALCSHRIPIPIPSSLPILLPILMFLPLPLLNGCADAIELDSLWRDRDVTIDGDLTEWEGFTHFIEEAHATVGVLNDEEHLYLSLASSNQSTQRQVLALGLTVWFDPDGGKERAFGIRFPLGMATMDRSALAGRRRPDPEELDKLLEEVELELEIIPAAGGEPHRLPMPVAYTGGIDVRVKRSNGTLAYELKVPLSAATGHPYAIGTESGATIGVGLETPEIDMGERPGMGGGPRGGSMGRGGGPGRGGGDGGGGRGGGKMPGGGRQRGGSRPEPPAPLEAWVKIHMAGDGDAELTGSNDLRREGIAVSPPEPLAAASRP
jgi:hypothetical protein